LALSTEGAIEMALQQAAQEPVPVISPTAQQLEAMGYVNVAALDPTLAVHIVYATADNFVGEVLYADLTEAYLLPEAAEKLVKAHNLLKESHPGYRFIIYDAARPMSVQRALWEVAVRNGKQYYVSNPAKGGGLHNYGAAVDLSILDPNGIPLPMGTGYDFFGPEANTDRENALLAEGKLTEEQLQNRLLLREVMREAGFRTITSEWWHFNHCSLPEAKERYELIDF
jgi:D-alanyl-D-alanine dipeptidase